VKHWSPLEDEEVFYGIWNRDELDHSIRAQAHILPVGRRLTPYRVTEELSEQVRAMREAGMTHRAIAAELHIAHSTVQMILRRGDR
jgi:DNA invertase Pin-like site-specific DNA recombinase